MSSSKVNFQGLHALRFFAASLVIIHHIEQYKAWQGLSSAWGQSLIDGFGHASVAFFFVLSGFLITYLLLVEGQETGSIHVGNFYWKRVLRIWPVYFLVVGIVILVVPDMMEGTFDTKHFRFSHLDIVFLLLFLPNLLRISFPWLVGGNHLWSVGVEEQFYIFWPLLVGIFRKRMVAFLLAFIAIKATVEVSLSFLPGESLRLQQIQQLLHLIPFEQMAIGGLGAVVVFLPALRKKMLPALTSRWVRYAAMMLLTWAFSVGWGGPLVSYGEAVVFLLVILNVTFTQKIYSKLEHPILRKLGDVSYGIYMYHPLVIGTVLTLLMPLMSELGWVGFNLLVYVLSIGGTLAVAFASYRWIERPILRLRKLLLGSKGLKLSISSN